MVHPRIFRQAVFLTVGFELILTLAAYLLAPLGGILLLGMRLFIAAVGGYLYGEEYEGGYCPSAMCGAIIGGIAVFPCVVLSVTMGMEAGSLIPVTTGAALLSGGIGGALGAWVAYVQIQEYK